MMMISRRVFLKTGIMASIATLLPDMLTAQGTIQAIFHGRDDLPQICLTYDDMWDEAMSLQIARTLTEHNIRATFFPAGLAIRANIDNPTEGHENLYNIILDLGHEFGCHTFTHPDITDLTAHRLVWWEIQPWIDVLEESLGFAYQPVALRPPMGIVTNSLFDAASQRNIPIVLWDSDMKDTFCAPDQCEDELIGRFEVLLKKGAIFLQHTNVASASIIERQIELMAAAELKPVLLSDMLAALNHEEDKTQQCERRRI